MRKWALFTALLLVPPLGGKAFQEVLWDIYFGKETCCEDLLEQILETCRKK